MVMPYENGGQHYIEESVSVYLRFDAEDGVWLIDGATVDGYALDSPNPDAPVNSECECEDREECDAVKDQARRVTLPAAEDLVVMLQQALNAKHRRVPAV